MSWRPEGWNYHLAKDLNLDDFSTKHGACHAIGWCDGYEAGADALLERLMKVLHVRTNETIEFEKNNTFTSDKPGHLVFIPDEEKDGMV